MAKPINFGQRIFDGILKIYRIGLRLGIAATNRTMLLVTIGNCLPDGLSLHHRSKGIFPQQDTGRISGSVQAAQDISFPAMSAKMYAVRRYCHEGPERANYCWIRRRKHRTQPGTHVHYSEAARTERKLTSDQIITELRRKLAVVPGATLFMQSAQDLTIGGRQSQAQYQYTLQGEDLDRAELLGSSLASQDAHLAGAARRKLRSAG